MSDIISTTTVDSDLAYVAAQRRSTSSSDAASVNFDDYITLMVAQLQNQDMYNSADTTEMTSQLAQYSLVSAAETIVSGQNTNYAATLVGKQVTASYSDSSGNLITETGTVSGVTLYEGEPLIYVNGVPYNLSEIMIIGTTDDSSADTSDTQTELLEKIAEGIDQLNETAAASEIAAEETEEASETAAASGTAEETASDDTAVDVEAIENGTAADEELTAE